MFRSARATLFWLLLFALPLQGFAGGAMQRCDAMSMPAAPVSHFQTPGHGIHADIGAGQPANAKSGALDCNGSAVGESWKHSPTGCAGLAACGVAGVYVQTMPTLLQRVVKAAPRVARSIPRFDFLTNAPDRPPRTID